MEGKGSKYAITTIELRGNRIVKGGESHVVRVVRAKKFLIHWQAHTFDST